VLLRGHSFDWTLVLLRRVIFVTVNVLKSTTTSYRPVLLVDKGSCKTRVYLNSSDADHGFFCCSVVWKLLQCAVDQHSSISACFVMLWLNRAGPSAFFILLY